MVPVESVETLSVLAALRERHASGLARLKQTTLGVRVVPSTPGTRFIRAEVTAMATLALPVMAALPRARTPVRAMGTIHWPLAVAVVT